MKHQNIVCLVIMAIISFLVKIVFWPVHTSSASPWRNGIIIIFILHLHHHVDLMSVRLFLHSSTSLLRRRTEEGGGEVPGSLRIQICTKFYVQQFSYKIHHVLRTKLRLRNRHSSNSECGLNTSKIQDLKLREALLKQNVGFL